MMHGQRNINPFLMHITSHNASVLI